MSDDRELVERLAAVDATPRASWVAELRADLDAAWETGDAGHLDSLRTTTLTLVDHEPPPSEPTSGRRWPILVAAAAAVVAIAVVATRGDDATVISPADTAVTSSTELVVPPLDPPIDCELAQCPWSPELTAQQLDLPIAVNCSIGPLCANLAVSPDGTLVAYDPAAVTLTWFEEAPRAVPLTLTATNPDSFASLVAIGPQDIAYIAIDEYYVAIAPSGSEIMRVAFSSRQPTPVYATATGLITGPRVRWPSPNAELAMAWVDLDGNPITDTRLYPTAKVTDAGIEVRLGERQWLLASEPGIRPRALDFLPRSDGGVVMVLNTSGWPYEESNLLLELSPDGSMHRYIVGRPALAMPDGSLIVAHNSQLVRLNPPTSP